MFLSYVAETKFILEGGDVNSAYLYIHLDKKITMKKPINSTKKMDEHERFCVLVKYLYGARQIGKLWGSIKPTIWNSGGLPFPNSIDFCTLSVTVPPLWFSLVVDDLEFASNYQSTLDDLKTKLKQTFDVKFYGALRQFIGCSINLNNTGITIDQKNYAKRLLIGYGFSTCNQFSTHIPAYSKENVTDSSSASLLSSSIHRYYRSMVGEYRILKFRLDPYLTRCMYCPVICTPL